MSYIIITDSTSDLPHKYVSENNIHVMPLTFIIDGVEYHNYSDEREMETKKFYDLLRKGAISKTAQLTTYEVEAVFESYLSKGYDILMIAFSSGLSGTYNAIKKAEENLQPKYSDRKIKVIDSLGASLGEGLMVYYANENKQKGLSLEENYNMLEAQKLRTCHFFTVDDIDTLKRGGRLSSTKAFLAKNLHIKPVLHVDNAGHLVPISKKIGRQSSLNELIKLTTKHYDSSFEQTIMIGHGDCIDEVNYIVDSLKKVIKFKEVIINNIGPVIGAHSGPGTIAIFFIGDER